MLLIIAGVVVATRGIMSDVILHEEYNDMFAGYMVSSSQHNIFVWTVSRRIGFD